MNLLFPILAQLIFLLVLLAAAGQLHASPGPESIVANYKIYKSGILIGTVEERLTRSGDTYRLISETQTAGALKWLLKDRVTLQSEGRISSQGLEPASYQFSRQNDSTKNISAKFESSRSRIVSKHHDKTEIFDLPAGTVDRISAMYQFAFLSPPSAEVTFWMSQGKAAEQYHYRRQGEVAITIGTTIYPTVHYIRDRAHGKPKAQLWLARDRYYLPIRMIFEDSRGLELEQLLVDLQTR